MSMCQYRRIDTLGVSLLTVVFVIAGSLCLAQIDVLKSLTSGQKTEDAELSEKVQSWIEKIKKTGDDDFLYEGVKRGFVNVAGGLKVRGPDGRLLGTLPEGAKVTILETRDGYYLIIFEGREAWIFAEGVTKLETENQSSGDNSSGDDGYEGWKPGESNKDSGNSGDSEAPSGGGGAVAQNAEGAHVYQFNGTPLDCGPSCAIIMGRFLGLNAPSGADSETLPAMRGLMGASATGVTNFTQITNGLSAMGGGGTRCNNASIDEIAGFVDSGKPVMLLGRPNGDAWANSSVNGGNLVGANGGVDHFVVVSGRDGDNWIINDPALTKPVVVSTGQLESFCEQSTQGKLGLVAGGGE